VLFTARVRSESAAIRESGALAGGRFMRRELLLRVGGITSGLVPAVLLVEQSERELSAWRRLSELVDKRASPRPRRPLSHGTTCRRLTWR